MSAMSAIRASSASGPVTASDPVTALRIMDAPGGRTARAAAGAPIIVFLLGLLYIVSYLDRLILALLVAPVRAEFGISDTAIALLVGPVFALFGEIGRAECRERGG